MRRILVAIGAIFLLPYVVPAGVVSKVDLKVGGETFKPSDKNGYTYQFSCLATASYSASGGMVLTFPVSTVISGDISWGDEDLTVNVNFGVTVMLQGSIHSNYGNTLKICGPGRLQIDNGRIHGYADVELLGAVVEITPSDSGLASFYSPGSISVSASLLSIAGYQKAIYAPKGISFTASMVSILAQGSQHGDIEVRGAIQSKGKISVCGCVLSVVQQHSGSEGICTTGAGQQVSILSSCLTIVSQGDCINGCGISCYDSRVFAISYDETPIKGRTQVDSDDKKAFFGDGEYVLCSAADNVGVYAGRIEVDGADIEICSPDSSGTYSWEFLMRDGSLSMVDKVDYKLVKQKMLTETAVMAVVGAYFKEWTTAHTALLGNILTDLDGAISKDPQGMANSAIEARRFYQLGGKISQGTAAHGYLARDSKLWTTYSGRLTPAFIGDSFNGSFEYYYNKQYHDLAPTNALGQTLTRVDYEPYWVYEVQPTMFEIAFDANGGTCATPSVSVAEGSAIGTLPTPTYSGYTFAGWFTARTGGSQISSSTVVRADATYYAHWDLAAVYRTVTFNANEGSCSESTRSVASGSAIGSLPTPTRSGYVFAGWFTSATGWTRIKASTVVNADMTVYAHWAAETDLEYYTPSNRPAALYVYRYGAEKVSVSEFEEGEEIWFRCNYVNNGGRQICDFKIQVSIGEKKWVFSEYETYLLEAGEESFEGRELQNHYLPVGEYDMTCTLDSEDSVLETNEANNTQTIHFKVVPKRSLDVTLTVKFNANDGTVTPSSKTYALWEACGELPIPTRPGYVFTGWYTSPYFQTLEEKIDASTVITRNQVFYAGWELSNTYTVTFDANGGECETDHVEVAKTVATVGSLPTPTWTKHKFDGWYTAATGGTKVTASTKVTADVTYYAHWTYDGSATVAVNVASGGEGMGTVSGGKTAKAGTKLTLKATAKKGYVFAGWYEEDAIGTIASTCVSQAASYSYVVGEEDATFYARFIPVGEDYADVSVGAKEEYARGEAIDPIAIEVNSGSLATVKVTGLPTGLKFTAKALDVKATKTTSAAHYAANTIYGTPTKSGVYTIVATVTTAGKKTASCSQTVVVRKADEKVVKADIVLIDAMGTVASTETVPGKVTGMGVYAVGKKVTLTATANKRFVFAGWYPVDAIVSIASEEDEKTLSDAFGTNASTCVSRSAAYSFAMPANDVELVAAFITSDEDKANISAAVNGMSFGAGIGQMPLLLETNVWTGVYLEWPVAVRALSTTTVKVSGLPSGLKFAAKDVVDAKTKCVTVPANTIYGAPSAASKAGKPSAVKLTVTTAGKSSQMYQINATVDPLPAWAQGSFVGGWETQTDITLGGQATLAVSTAGKISGKAIGAGTTYALTAPYYSEVLYQPDDDSIVTNFCADISASWNYKIGTKSIKTNEMFRVLVQDTGIGGCASTLDWFEVYKTNWKQDPWKEIAKALEQEAKSGNVAQYYVRSDGGVLDGTYGEHDLGEEYVAVVTLKFSANGVVKETGEFVTGYDAKRGKYKTVKASGSTIAVPTSVNDGIIFVYLTPKGLSPHSYVVRWGKLFD